MGERGNKPAPMAGRTVSAAKAGDQQRDSRRRRGAGLEAGDGTVICGMKAPWVCAPPPLGWGVLSHALPRESPLLSHRLHSACSSFPPAI